MGLRRYLGLFGFLLVAVSGLVCQAASAATRVALVIGNSQYRNVPQLANPDNDAAAFAQTMKQAGFDVVDARHDLTGADMRRALRDFGDKARNADMAVIYYAGHGIEVEGTNYLIPVDAALQRDTDVYDEAVSLDRVLVAVESAKQLRLVILDACRDNPFNKTMKKVSMRSVGRGLAKVEPTSPNTLIAYAAKAGSTAADGDNKNSPFTDALVRHIATPGLDVRKAFGFVRDDVLKVTNNRQEPYVYGSLGGEDVPLVPVKAAPSAVAPVADARVDVRRDYELSLQLGTRAAWDTFLKSYPTGFYADLAKGQIDKIRAEDARLAATAKARETAEEKARLAAEGAKQGEIAKAAAVAKTAEDARIAAEQAKRIKQAKVDAAEQSREAAERAADTQVSKAEAATSNMQARGPSQAGAPASSSAPSASQAPAQQTASLSPAAEPVAQPALSAVEINKSVQIELRRVGCFNGSADGEWGKASRLSLENFNRHADAKLDVKVASLDTLGVIKSKTARVCPLICRHGYKADGDACAKITCGEGKVLNDDNECVARKERKVPSASRERDNRRPRRAGRSRFNDELDAPQAAAPRLPSRASAKPEQGGVVCDDHTCHPIKRGCRIEFRTTAQGGGVLGGGSNVEICH
ncbi:caspase family protein [Nitrobacter sp.]|uniref:caspase family protein n=1 Tax=Nitrobacter sp. TaxID=29420 RepID=UPI003F653F96